VIAALRSDKLHVIPNHSHNPNPNPNPRGGMGGCIGRMAVNPALAATRLNGVAGIYMISHPVVTTRLFIGRRSSKPNQWVTVDYPAPEPWRTMRLTLTPRA
jgi:hypothetical protein